MGDDGYGRQCLVYDEEQDVYICPQGRELTRRRELTHNGREYVVYAGIGCRECGARGECIRDRHHRQRQLWRRVGSEGRERMKERLRTAEGRALYAVRGRTVEPVFGQMKGSRRFDRLLLRGLPGARAEVALMCLAHNLMKCARQASAVLRALLSFTRSLGRVIGGASRPCGAKIASLPAGRRQSLTIPLSAAF